MNRRPSTYTTAKKVEYAELWHTAVSEEYNAQIANGTWDIVGLPPGRKVIGSLWVCVRKLNPTALSSATRSV